MNWRHWLKSRMDTVPGLEEFDVYGGGSLTGSPEHRPFIVINVGLDVPELNDGDAPAWTRRMASIWVHDDPGSYDRIDDIISAIRGELVGQVSREGAICCLWDGDSDQLADDMMGTITRYISLQLVGRSA